MTLRKIVWTASFVLLLGLLAGARRLVNAHQAALAGTIAQQSGAFYGH